MSQKQTRPELRLSIVGTGAMAAAMAQAAGSVTGARVSAILSRDAERAAAFCAAFAPGAIPYGDSAQMFEHVDAVYVATPPATHVAFVEMAIDAGKAVLCEKPLTMSAADTTRLLARARDANVLVMEAIWTLALPAYRALRETPGPRRNALLHFDFSYPVAATADSHIRDPETGGVLIDRSVYGYAAAISLLGDVVRQSVWVARDDTGVDTEAELRLEHAEGARALISLSLDKIGSNKLYLTNDSGLTVLGPPSLAAENLSWLPHPDPHPPQGAAASPGLKARLKASPRLRAIKSLLPGKRRFLSYGSSSYVPILEAFLTALAQGRVESDIVPHGLSTQIAALTEDARQRPERGGT